MAILAILRGRDDGLGNPFASTLIGSHMAQWIFNALVGDLFRVALE